MILKLALRISESLYVPVYDIRYFHFFTLFEAVDKSVSADKVELINVAFLPKNTPIKVIDIELPEFRTFKLMNFQGRMFRIFFEKGYLLFKFFLYFFREFVILR